ncbi:MAG: DUF3887 domain-containing protein [Lachnospiraceae bacterium]|nr:DUF3887 domain-containing protein [Lachnospiraceae bacterium]
MDERQYVNAIARRIKCNGKKKKEIKRQLLTDITMRTEQGEDFQEIISQMGTVKEIADGFNDNISEKEIKQYIRNRVIKIALSAIVVIIILALILYWMLPKSFSIEQSKYFDKEQVEDAMRTTIELLDVQDYATIQENAIPKMQSVLNQETMENVRKQIAEDWGQRESFGVLYTMELVQGNEHFAVGEVTVSYENATVTYRLTYDREMQLAGLFIR